MKIKITRLSPSAQIPFYANPGDAGLDLVSTHREEIPPHESRLIKTGIAIELPLHTEAQVRPRSGLALKNQITVLNSPGTIDSGYRGEIGVILINHGKNVFVVEPGMKIAQMVIASVLHAEIEVTDQLSETKRGEGGFGSTGV